MRVEGIEVLVAPLALGEPVASAGRTQLDKTTLFLRVVTDAAIGWGECAAYPAARPPDLAVDDLEPVVVDQVLGRLRAAEPTGTLPPADAIAATCGGKGSVGEQMVAATIEMAVLDAELKALGRSLASWLGIERTQVESGSLVGIPPGRDIGRLLDAADAAIEGGARRLRLKIEPGWDRTPLAAVRNHCGDVPLLADANGSYSPGQQPALRALDDFALVCLEQPFAPGDLAAHRSLVETMVTPIGLDESLWSPGRVEEAVGAGACQVACLKPGRLGGVAATISAAVACASAGIACFVGGFFETGLARALNAALAGRDEFSLPGDLGDPDGYLVVNPFSYLKTAGGLVLLSEDPGIGVEPRLGLLERVARRRWVSWSS